MNCIPFGCDASYGINTYQQVYSSSAFSGVNPFNQVSFFLGQAGSLDSGTYDIYFSYTSQPVNGLSSASPSDNIGADETLFGSYTLPGGSAPSTLTFSGNTFSYDPTMGNLLMTIDMSGVVDGGSYLSDNVAFYDADDTGTVTSRAYFGSTQNADSTGLVTGFDDVSSVPEPAHVVYLLGLLMVIAVAARRRFTLERTR